MNKAQIIFTIVATGVLAWLLNPKEKRTTAPSEPVPPTPPIPPAGWTPLTNAELTPELRSKAVEILGSGAPLGSMVPFTASDGRSYGGFVTIHEGTKRAVEIWRPA